MIPKDTSRDKVNRVQLQTHLLFSLVLFQWKSVTWHIADERFTPVHIFPTLLSLTVQKPTYSMLSSRRHRADSMSSTHLTTVFSSYPLTTNYKQHGIKLRRERKLVLWIILYFSFKKQLSVFSRSNKVNLPCVLQLRCSLALRSQNIAGTKKINSLLSHVNRP